MTQIPTNHDDIYLRVAKNIKIHRALMGWTQQELADQSGLHLAHIEHIEAGLLCIQLRDIQYLADVFGLTPGRLLDGVWL